MRNIAIINFELTQLPDPRIKELSVLVRDEKGNKLYKKDFEEFSKRENNALRETLEDLHVFFVAVGNVNILKSTLRRQKCIPFIESFSWIDLRTVCAKYIGSIKGYTQFCEESNLRSLDLETFYAFIFSIESKAQNLEKVDVADRLLIFLQVYHNIYDLRFLKEINPKIFLK